MLRRWSKWQYQEAFVTVPLSMVYEGGGERQQRADLWGTFLVQTLLLIEDNEFAVFVGLL